jgi:hypothetical protein
MFGALSSSKRLAAPSGDLRNSCEIFRTAIKNGCTKVRSYTAGFDDLLPFVAFCERIDSGILPETSVRAWRLRKAHVFPMKFRSGLFGLLLLSLAALPASAATELRFSTGLSAAQKIEAGLDHLSADQIATIDALVQRTVPTTDEVKTPAPPIRFSQRLAATERAAAGLDQLSADELSQLDTFVAAQATAEPTKSVPPFKPDDWTHRLRVHGSVTLGIGGGHGYSTRFAEGEIEIYDPVTGVRLSVAYGTSRDKFTLPAGWAYLRPLPRDFQRR